MKKFSFILMMAALALPMMGQRASTSKAEAMRMMNRDAVENFAPVKSFGAVDRHAFNAGRAAAYTWDFESEESIAGWSSWDADGDGYGWDVDDYYSYPDGTYSLTSRSYYGGQALTPDNWLISPQVELDGILSFYAQNYASYYPEQFAVYVYVGELGENPNADDFVKISDDIVPPAAWTEYTFDLSEYAGANGCFAIRHYGTTDQFRLLVDYFTLGVAQPPMAMPENVTVTPTATTADVAWDDAENAAWNLRYRPVPTGYFWDFEEPEASDYAVPAGWSSIDADGDGYTWYHLNQNPGSGNWNCHSGYGHLTSASYSGGVLYPDNWLISPKVTFNGNLSFWAAGQDPSYASEVFAVYVSTGNPTIDEFVKVSDDITATGEVTEYTFDLSAYAGQEGYVAIRHYNVSDMFRLNIDDVLIGEQTEWIYVNGLEATNYTIEGLTPETTYEVQVMAYNDNEETAWTESTIFTTLAGGEQPTEMCLAPNSGYEITGVETATVTITNREEGATVVYEVYCNDELVDNGSFTGESYSFVVTGDGNYVVHAIATMPGKLNSPDGGVFFTILEGEGPVGIDELAGGKQVAGVRYYNALGQEMQQANGMTIVVTTYTDGTTSTAKVVK